MNDADKPPIYLYPGPTIAIVENTLDLADLDDLVSNLQPTFVQVEITKRVAGPAAGGFMPEAALYIAFGVVALAFLHELGKDLYKGFRAALFSVYQRAKTWANSRGYAPLSIHIDDESGAAVVFIFKPGLSAEEFDNALLDLVSILPEVDKPPSDANLPYVILEFDEETKSWKRSAAF